MKTLAKFGFCVFLGSAVSGCGAMSTSGGTAGWAENHLLFKANDDIEYIYRAMSITAALSAAATANTHTISNTGNARQAISQINGLMETLDSMYAIAVSPCGSFNKDTGNLITEKCDDWVYRTRFQSLTPDIDRQLINLASVSLESDSYISFVKSIESGNYAALPIQLLKMTISIMEIGNQALGSARQTSQERRYMYSTKEGRQGIGNEVFSYEEAQSLLQTEKIAPELRNDFYSHYLQATFVSIQQNCLNIRSKLPQEDQKIDDVSDSYYFERLKGKVFIRAGTATNNCMIKPYFGRKTANYNGLTGDFKGINIGDQTSPVNCLSEQEFSKGIKDKLALKAQPICQAKTN